MKKTIFFGSVLVVTLLLMLPAVSATHGFEKKEDLAIPPTECTHSMPLIGGPLYNMLMTFLYYLFQFLSALITGISQT